MRYYTEMKNENGKMKMWLTRLGYVAVFSLFTFHFSLGSAQVTIGGSVYGGGNKAAGTVTGTVNVEVKAGTVTHSVYGGGNLANVNGATQVTIDNVGKVNHSVFGGGHAANVTSANVIINNGTVGASGGTGLYGVYGGCDSMGTVSGAIAVNINGGALGTATKPLLGIFGGGYGPATTTSGSVTVTIGSLDGSKAPQINTDIYGGSALGSVNSSNNNDTTKVNIFAGTLHGNVYGGGLGLVNDTTDNVITDNSAKGQVNGVVQVNVGAADRDNCPIEFASTSAIYGCNNTNGSPKDNVFVNIYKTAHNIYNDSTKNNTQYAIDQVFGGGRNAHYIPSGNGRATVTVYSCENTIGRVFGGGDAANAYGVGVEIWGGRFNQVFGGGNGELHEASIGYGGTNTQVHGGYINQLFGGSNENGTIAGSMTTSVENTGTCPEKIRDFFGGSNKVPIIGDITTTIACGAIFENVYGGSNEADITGNVTLNINGGTITNVYGGSKGATDKGADIKDDGSGTMGTVTLNLTGGTITNAFGGSNINGNIDNLITVNVNENESLDSACALHITNIYGASNLAFYKPKDSSNIISPVVNIHHIKAGSAIAGNVYGGGKGAKSIFNTNGTIKIDSSEMGRCISNPQVNLGDSNAEHFVKIHGNVYGGGALSYVKGYTKVNMFNANDTAIRTVVEGSIFGAGQGYVGDSLAANVTKDAMVNITGGQVLKNVYGGGELASVGTFIDTTTGHTIVWNTGTSRVFVKGGVIGPDIIDNTSSTANGNVYGAGLGKAGSQVVDGHNYNFAYYNYVNNSEVVIDTPAVVRGSVFGGGEDGHVWNNTCVKIKGGEVGTELTSEEATELADGASNTIIYTGNVYGGGRGISVESHSFNAGRVFGNTFVEVTGGLVHHNVYGGGSLASVGDTIHNKNNGKAYDIMGNVISGQYRLDTLGGTLTRDYQKGDPVTGTGIAKVIVAGGRIGHTGHNEGSVFGSGRGLAGEGTNSDYYHMAFVHNSEVYIKDTVIKSVVDPTVDSLYRYADVRESVFGGGANGHVTQNSYVKVSGGVIGGKDSLTYVAMGIASEKPLRFDTILGGDTLYSGIAMADTNTDRWGRIPDEHHTFLGNVYAGGRGVDHNASGQLSRYAGRVFGNAKVEVTGGVIYHSVYGGGSMASVGYYTGGQGSNMNISTQGTGKAVVNITGGRIGTNGRNNGRVFGSSRGLAGTNYSFMAYVNTSDVTIGGDAEIRGCVFGSGENGHVLDSTLVKIEGGEIGNGIRSGNDSWINGLVGNVYGGGRGVDLDNAKNPDVTAGLVRGSTHVTVSGGHIHHNVYGGGSMASVGPDSVAGYSTTNGRNGRTWVEVTGGRIGIVKDVNDKTKNLYGSVYGAGRGRAGIGLVNGNCWDSLTFVANTNVIINFEPSETTYISGNVFGGGDNGHVNNSTYVTVTRGKIGTHGALGYGSLEGNVFGGGRGEDTYEAYLVKDGKYVKKDGVTTTNIPYNRNNRTAVNNYLASDTVKNNPADSIATVDSLSTRSGLVYGNTHVVINGANKNSVWVTHNVYGGGSMSSVGDLRNGTGIIDSLTPGTGATHVYVTGGTVGSTGTNNGMIFGSSRGDMDAPGTIGDTMAWVGYTQVTIGDTASSPSTDTNIVIKGSVYGGGENGHVYRDTYVHFHDGLLGCDSAEYANMNSTQKADNFPFRGNVYGAGCGTDQYVALDGKNYYNPMAGSVQGNTEVKVSGGYVSRNVYGAGSMGSVGTITAAVKNEDTASSFALSWPYRLTYKPGTGHTKVTINGGYIGTKNAPEGISGDVYGSARGEAGDRYEFATLANANTTQVTIDFTPSNKNVLLGSVYGSGENGHVYDSTRVTFNNGLINGALFGGGKGSDTYQDSLRNTATHTWAANNVRDITAGKVYGNTHVVMNGGRVNHNVYGGGYQASVGKGNYNGGYGEFTNVTAEQKAIAENSGHSYVTINGGEVGDASDATNINIGHVFGAGKGIVFPMGDSVGFDYNRDFYVAYTNKTFVTIDNTAKVYGSVFGGGEDGHVRYDTWVKINGGQIGVRPPANVTSSDIGDWIYKGNVFGAGRGIDKLTDGSYCQSAGSVTRNTRIDVNGGRIFRNVMGGGSMASVGSPAGFSGDSSTCVININLSEGDTIGDGRTTHKTFGGYLGGGSRGIASPDGADNSALATCENTQVNVNGGYIHNSIYGGGENGQILGNTEINIRGGYVRASIYGGGKGSWKAPVSETGDATGDYSQDTLSGFIHGNTTVNLLGGEVPFTYGGCRRASVGGNTNINIGKVNGDGSYSGEVAFISGKNKVYGGNQYAGTPKGDITVNVYSTAHGEDPAHNKYPAGVTDSASLVRNDSIQTYAIGAVYGGSYNSHYRPRPGHSATVHVYGCENTIEELYGGGAAADVGDSNVNANTNLIIDGGRFKKVFGGGDGTLDRSIGQQVPANIYGVATTQIHSGLITEFFGGSNQMGNVKTISTQIDHDTTRCAEVIGNLYSGSNESDIYGNGELIIACGAGEFNEVYGGSNNAQIHGNVTLTIRGGTIGTVFGGSKGRLDDPTTTDTNESFAANIDGNVTLNLEGGTIGEAFGGSNINGAIHGIITVNVLDTCQGCPLQVENVYGAGNITPYTPDSVIVNGVKQTPASPLVNIKHTATPTTFTGSVYGGGFGAGAVVTANPIVTIGDDDNSHTALVGTNVFGGGSFAEVKGNTTVLIQNPNTRVSGAIYGGGALADVRSTNVTLNSGTVGGNIYGGGLGRNVDGDKPAVAAKVNGDVQVTVNGGKAANIYGANNINGAPTGIVKVDIYGTDLPASGYALGNVFGGGNHAVYDSIPQVTIHNCNNKIEYVYGGGNAASVKGTNVVVYGGDTIGNVYGGCYGANVTSYGTLVNVHGGSLGSVFGGNNASGTIEGPIHVNVNKQAEGTDDACEMHISRVYGGGNHADSKAGIISIGCTGGETEGIDTVFGGANQANIAGKIELDITGGHINNVFGGNNISGNITDSITINVNWDDNCTHNYLGNIYGAGNLAQYKPTDTTISSPIVNLINGTVSGNVYGGGYGIASETKKGLVNAHPIVNIGDTTAAHANSVVLVKGDVLGGGALAQVVGNTKVNILKGTVDGSVFGGGEGFETNPVIALVMKNATVNMIDGRVKGSVYGGGKVSSVGYYNTYEGANLPESCENGTGHTAVFVSGGTVGPDTLMMPAFTGHVFGGGKGKVADPVSNPAIKNLAYSNTTEVVVSDSAFIKGSVYGGSESGHVFDSTYVKIQGGQIGSGFNYANNTNYGPYTDWTVASLAECHHWPFETSNLAYDPYANKYDSKGGAVNATDGHTYYGNVFGGGSGVFPYQPVGRTDTAVWSKTAGAVYGNTRVEVTGGHILTSLYGGNEMTNVGTYDATNTCIKGGTASVIMTGGALGVPRTLDSITAHPVTCYLFGAGKGDPRIFFNTSTNVDSAYVRIGAVKGQDAPRIYGSVLGGGEDGHVMRNISLNIDSGAYIGTEGLSHYDGNVFGAGRGFSGDALTAGSVGGNIVVNITGGTMLGNVYGGGRLASVGTLFAMANNPNYGKMQEGDDHGFITVNISGGAVIGTEAVFGATRPTHLLNGNVYGGSMGRLTLANGKPNPIWPDIAKVKNTEINISDSVIIRATVFGGSELGTVTGNTKVNITGDKARIGTVKRDDSDNVLYRFGSVFGGGYGTDVKDSVNINNKRVPAGLISGRVYGNTEVNIDEGAIANNVFGGGKRAYVGDSLVAGSGNTTVNIGNASQSSNSVVIGNCVYGANDETGSPLGNTNVHIYHTGHSVTPVFKVGDDTILRGNSYPTVRRLAEPYDVYDYADVAVIIANNLAADFVDTGRFAIKAVYGGGNYATHTPVADTGTTLVHIHNCESNTIYQVFGGGNAAGTKNNSVIVDGGHIHHLFGGGNGKERPADATGIATTRVHGGLIDTVFGGSNFNGTCAADLRIDHTSPCEELIASIFGGGNYSPGHGGSLTIDCGTGYASVVYGGSNMASNVGNIELNINGGTFDSVFAGSRGSESIASDIDGDVTLNLHGGTIVNAFGGSNYNGNITGVITVNVEDTSSNCALALHNLYGASNLATYHPTDTTITSPVVNIRHIPNSITGNVFGAGHGMESNFVNGVCQRDNVHRGKSFSNPRVNIGDNVATHIAWIRGNVYGGGELAEVEGSTTVTMQNANSHVDSNLFGAGKGYVGDSIAANVAIHSNVAISAGRVKKNVYGGGELASVGTFIGTSGDNDIKEGTGNCTVSITGGFIGADAGDHATNPDANGNVYGAGLGRAGTATNHGGLFHFAYYNYVNNSDVTIGGNARVYGSVFGGAEDGHVWRNTEVYVKGGEIGTELTATETEENADGIGRDIYTGNVYGGGRGIDESDLVHHTHSMTAGRVFGNSYVEVTGGVIHRDVFGGGSLASVGDTIHEITANGPTDIMGNIINGSFTFDTSLDGVADSTRVYRVGDPVTGTGLAEVVIAGGRIGHTGHNEGSVFGSGRGLAGDNNHQEYYHMAFTHNTKVTIKDTTIVNENNRHAVPDIRGAVFGGGANGHVTQNAYVKMSAGVVGGKTASDFTDATRPATKDTTINGIDYYSGIAAADTLTDDYGRLVSGRPTFLGNVYGGGRGVDTASDGHLSRYAGRVFGNAKVEITGGVVYHSVYGGGSMASVGHYTVQGLYSIANMVADTGTGLAVVKVTGGRIGNNGRNNGRIFGAGRGLPGTEYNFMSFVNTTDVTVGGTAKVRGSVFGAGENGHVLDSTLVKIEGGTIGNGFRRGNDSWINEYIGNVYGGGRGVDLDKNNMPSTTAGWVKNSTHVIVSGGHIHHNVYGAGSLASVGRNTTVTYDGTYGLNDREGRSWVDITGGLIGIVNDPADSSVNHYGHVYGAGRGRAGVGIVNGNDWDKFTFVSNSVVNIHYDTINEKNYITGNVFGGGNNGHVNNSTSVTVTKGKIGTAGNRGYGSLEGNVFGGSRGEDTYETYLVKDGYYVIRKDSVTLSPIQYSRNDRSQVNNYRDTLTSADRDLVIVDSLSRASGRVLGNANVLINAAKVGDVQIMHHVYGGGSMASVGTFGKADAAYVAEHSELEIGELYSTNGTNTGTCRVTITGGTIGTAGINNGMVFGASRGDIGAPGSIYDTAAYVSNTIVTIGTQGQDTVFSNPLIHGSVYGGGENGHTVDDARIYIHSGSIGRHGNMYDQVKNLEDEIEKATDATVIAAKTSLMNQKLDSLAYCGNVYGGGCGTDKYDSDGDGIGDTYNVYAGVVFGNSYITMDGGYVERNIYGSGAMANLGRRTKNDNAVHDNADTCFALSWPVDVRCRPGIGRATINISGGARVGYSGKDNGDIFGASRGEAGDRYAMARIANVDSTIVTINIVDTLPNYYNTNPKDDHRTPLIAGSVYGGAENGHVITGTNVQLVSGIVGHSIYGGGKGKGTYKVDLWKIGTAHTEAPDSLNVDIYSITAGRVYGNTHITMTGGKVIRNIYGGGNMASIGKGNYAGGPGSWQSRGYGEKWTEENKTELMGYLNNSGHAYVTVTGGTVGILDPAKPKNSVKDDLPLGNVFGGCRGEAAPNVDPTLSPRYAYAPSFFSGYVNHTHVVIGTEGNITGPRLYGSVYGGGQDGHVRGETNVIINSGEIGVPYVDSASAKALVGITDLDNIHWVARGNVYGAGSGIGKYTRNGVENYGTSSGSVTDSTKVVVLGGTIHRNIYGGGSLASIGPLVLGSDPNPDTTITKTVVIVKGGQVGDATDFEQGYGGSVYGASRGMAEVAPNDYANVWWSRVNVENPADIAGSVYGGGEVGHVKRDTRVNLFGGHVGGSVYGAGRGLSGNEYKHYCNVDSTFVTLSGGQVDADVYGGAQDGHVKGNTHVTIAGATIGVGNTSQLEGNVFGGGQGSGEEVYTDNGKGGTDTSFNIYVTCGRVAGNTTVNMTSGHLHGSIFGGGRLALTGVDTAGAYVDAQHGNAVITVSGTADTIKAVDGITDSIVYSTIIGTDNIDSLLRCNWSVGDIFGSGKGDIDYYSDVLAGRVTNTTITVNGEPIIRGGVFGGGEMASIGWWGNGGNFYDGTGAATITINGGTIGSAREFTYDKPVHDTLSQRVGNENPGEWTMYNDDGTILHTCTGNVFGGSQGDVDTECPHWVSMGRSRTGNVTINGGSILGGVYGGSEQGIVTGNTAVTINGGTIGIIVTGTDSTYYYGDVYAAGYGCDDESEWGVDDWQSTTEPHNDSTAGSQALHLGWNPGLLAGRTFGDARVDVLGGTIYGSVYGGGSFASVGDDKSTGYNASTTLYPVNGNTLVNIGSETEGSATIYGDVFGANNYKGSPYGNTEVNIYHVAHVGNNSYPDTTTLKARTAPTNKLTGTDLEAQTQAGAQGYALRAVYGGGNMASHTPIDTVNGTTRVRVYFCDENTVHTVYGGGNAADTRNNSVIIDGGRIYRVFGGGNGYSETGNHDDPDAPNYNPGADVLGTASTHVNAGLIDQVYGGSNQLGNIAHVDLSVTHDSGDCIEVINESFGGGNEAPGGGGEVVIKCGTYLENFYAGANAARLGTADKPVKLKVDIQGGNIGNFFGGCKGTEDEPADIYGDITVNYHGGRIVNLFGGSDVNGNISGTITVNVDVYPDFCKCADGLQLDRIYGGGRDAAYTPYDPFRGSPTVNIKNNRYRWVDDRPDGQYTAADSAWVDIIGVFGGGLGATATCTSYPRVIIGGFPDTTTVENNQTIVAKRFARIQGNVYGGGEAAPVVGNTLVMIRDASVARNATDIKNTGMVFGGGLGATAKVTGETYVGIFGHSDIANNVYGGGNAGIVTGSTELQLAYQQQVFPAEFIAFLDADDGNKLKGKFVCTTPDVKYSYTKDGSEPPVPATAATLWNGVPFEFGWNDTVLCIAYLWDATNNKIDSSMIPSFVAFDKATMPVITIKEGTGTNPDTVTLGGSIGARIRYTLDGTDPTHANGTTYGIVGEADGTPFTISGNQVVKAMAEMRGCYNSSVSALTAEAPTITLTGNHVRIEGPAGSKITYTYGSSDVATPIAPMAGSTRPSPYTGTDSDSNVVEFYLPSATSDYTIKAVAYKPGYLPSLISAKIYRAN